MATAERHDGCEIDELVRTIDHKSEQSSKRKETLSTLHRRENCRDMSNEMTSGSQATFETRQRCALVRQRRKSRLL